MKKCSYCGRDNADEAENCRECGTVFETLSNTAKQEDVKTVVVRVFGNREAAIIAAAALEAHGIESSVSADDCAGMYPSLMAAQGVRLRVRASDEDAANGVLDSIAPAPAAAAEIAARETGAVEPVNLKQARRKIALIELFGGAFIGVFLTLLYQGYSKPDKYFHYDSKGRIDGQWIYKNDCLIEYDRDRNHDGQWDDWTYYDGRGNVERGEADNNFDGKADEIWYYTNGDLVRLEKDTDFNGTPDEFATYNNHIIQEMEIRPNGAKFATVREFFKNGVLTEEWRGGDSNGNFREKLRYDPFFNPINTNVGSEFQLLTAHSK